MYGGQAPGFWADVISAALDARKCLIAEGVFVGFFSRCAGAKMESFTESEVAGMGVGALLLIASVTAPKIDFFFAKYQRRSLGLCEECGGATRVPCKKCKGRGRAEELVTLPWSSAPAAPSCNSCRATGQLPCPTCSRT